MPAGKLSVTATPVCVIEADGFVMVKVREVDPPEGIEAAPKDLLIDGGTVTVKVAEAEVPLPPLEEVTLLVVLA
jgi:hypothetical protein